MNFEDIRKVLSCSCYGNVGVVNIPFLEISDKKDSVTVVTQYYAPSEGWYPLLIISKHAYLYTKEEIKKSSELFSRMVLDPEYLKLFFDLYNTAHATLLAASSYFFSDVAPNNILIKEDMSDMRIIDVLSLHRYDPNNPPSINYSKLIMGKPLRFDPAPSLYDLVIDEDTGEKYFDPENLTKLRRNMKKVFMNEDDDADYSQCFRIEFKDPNT